MIVCTDLTNCVNFLYVVSIKIDPLVNKLLHVY